MNTGGSAIDIHIRSAGPKDFDLIWKATIETVWQDLPPEERAQLDRHSFEDHFRPHAQRVIESQENAVFIAETPAGATAGYIVVGGATSMLSPLRFGFVYDVWVAPEFRRRGVARRLLDRAVGWCRSSGYGSLRLEVNARNAPARALYAATGFVEERLSLRKVLQLGAT